MIENNYGYKIRQFMYQYRKFIVPGLYLLAIILLLSLFAKSHALRDEDKFNEIQSLIDKAEWIYNPIEVISEDKLVKGIDVSSWQGEIDWDRVKKSGIDFAMIRVGFRNNTNDEISLDRRFHYNIKEANRVGIPVGVYFYSTAISEEEVLVEAAYVLNQIKDYKVIYPVAYDFEMFNKNRTKGISDEIINNNAYVFLDYMEHHGYTASLYTNLNALKNHWNLDMFSEFDLWYAQYIDNSTYDGKYQMWQYSDRGRIDGIKGNVDLNEGYVAYIEK